MKYSIEELTSYYPEILEKTILPNAPNCEVFRKNITAIMSNMIDIVKKNGFVVDPNSNLHREVIIHLYSSEKSGLFKKYGITDNNQDIIYELEMNALTYIGAVVAKTSGVKYLEISKKLRRIEALSDKLMREINSIDSASKFTVAAAFSVEDFLSWTNVRSDTPKEEWPKLIADMGANLFLSRFAKFQESLEFSLSIHESLANTFVGKNLQFGVRGPKANSALDVWIEAMVKLWANDLNRSISHSENKYEGREQFLRFLEDCMYPLHEEIEADTIRNAFEKLREKGAFDYLSKKLN